jgi:thioredoxin 1
MEMSEDEEAKKIKQRMAESMRVTITQTGSGEPIDLTDATFDKAIRDHSYIMVDFWAPWCGPCRFVSPVLEELAKDYAGKITLGKVNVDENPTISNRFMISSIPTIKFFKDGEEVDSMIGAAPRPYIEQRLKAYL